MLGLLSFIPLLGAGFELGAGLGKLRQALLAACQFLRNRHAVGHIRFVRGFRPRQQLGHFRFSIAPRSCRRAHTTTRCAGWHWRGSWCVQRDGAHLEHPHLARQLQHLHKQPLDLLEKAPAERRDRVVVGMVVRRDEAERNRIVRRPLRASDSKTLPSHTRKREDPAAAQDDTKPIPSPGSSCSSPTDPAGQ